MRLRESLLLPVAMLALLPGMPARADYIGDAIEQCGVALTPASRQGVIAACDKVIQMGELQAWVEGPAYVSRGNAYALGADYPKALADFAIAMDLEPKDPAPYGARGVVLLKQKKFADAFADFDSAVKLDGGALALYGRGFAARKLGRGGDDDLNRANALDPGMAAFYAGNGLEP